jgi:uncharacterized repeat protein (TIGR03803 family)
MVVTRTGFAIKGHASKYLCRAVLFLAATAIGSSAQTFTTLFDFDESDGEYPQELSQGFDGNLYGTTAFSGAVGAGTFFGFASDTGTLTTLHTFCSHTCLDGRVPAGGQVQATNGDFYGGTNNGGTQGLGVIYRITAGGKFSTIYNFCSQLECADGEDPQGLMQATDGNLYGTAAAGGSPNCFVGCGTIFEITPSGTFTILHTFDGTDGDNPYGTLIESTNGNFYGTTVQGGSSANCRSGCGTVFRMTHEGALTTLHSFDGTDGASPEPLVQAMDGNLYGTTDEGGTGAYCSSSYGCGTFFTITSSGQFINLYNFCSQANCSDGSGPGMRSLLQATDGNIYGTTIAGGTGFGTIFKITPNGDLTTLYEFCSQQNCTDGSEPVAELIQDTDGSFYGTTSEGGQGGMYGPGTIFRLSTGLGPFVRFAVPADRIGETGPILGQGFTGTTGVFLNGTPASFSVVSDTLISATVPAGASSGYVTVTTPTGTLTSNVPFLIIP